MAAMPPRRLGWLIALVIIMTLATAGLAPAATAPKVVTVAVGQDLPPFYFKDQKGQSTGWLVDLWKLWSAKTGIKVKFVPMPFGETLKMVGAGRVDIQGGCFYSKSRAKYLDYVTPLAVSDANIFFQKNVFGLNGLKDLLGFRVGLIKGDYAIGYLRKHLPGVSLAEFPTYKDLHRALTSGAIRVFLVDEPTGKYYLSKWGLMDEFRYFQGPPLYQGEWRAAVQKGNTILPPLIRRGMALISAQEKAAIERHWAGRAQTSVKGALRIACDSYMPPYTMLTPNGQPAGLLIDFWRLWSRKTGKKIEFVFGDWADTIRFLREGRADIHSGLYRTPQREKFLDFSLPVYYAVDSFAFRRGQKALSGKALAKAKVGVMAGSAEKAALAKKYPAMTLVPYKGFRQLFDALRKGEVQAVYGGGISLQNTLEKQGLLSAIHLTKGAGGATPVLAGVPKGHWALLGLVNQGIQAISNQEMRAIEEQWVADHDLRFFATGGRPAALNEQERAWIAKRKNPVIAGAEMDWPPFDFVESGKVTGFSNDLLRLAAKNADLPLRFVHGLTWAEMLAKFKKGEIDILPAVYKTPERMRQMAFTKDYAANPTVMVVGDQSSSISDLQDLANKKLAVVQGFSITNFLMEKHPKVKQVPVKNVLEGLKAVSLKKADAFVGSLGVITYVLDQNVIPNVHIVNEVVLGKPKATHLFMVTAKDQYTLRNILNKGLEAVTPEEMRGLRQRWLPVSIGNKEITKEFALSDLDKKWLAQHPKITLGVDPAWMPFEGINSEGVYQGVAASFIELISKKLGVPLNPALGLTWPQVLAKARKGGVDLLPAAMRTRKREQYLLFTKPYLNFPVVVVTRENAPVILRLDDLKGKLIAVPKDYATIDLIKKDHPELRLKEVADIAQGLTQVADGEAYAYLGNMASINYTLKSLGLKKLKIAATTKYSFALSMAVRKDWPRFAAMVQRALNSLTPEEKSAITSQWINIRFAERVDWGFIARAGAATAAVVAIILAIIIIWNRRMAREVLQRKEAEQRLAAMVANIPGAIFQMDVYDDGRREYRYLSPQSEEFFLASSEEVISQRRRLPWHPDDTKRVLQDIEKAIAEGRDLSVVGRILLPGGEVKWVQLNASAEKASKGVRLATGFILDVTDRMLAEERFKNMAANVPGTIFQFTASADGQARFTYVNKRAEEFWGAPPEVIIAEKRLLQFHPEDKDRAIGEINQALVKKQKLNLVARIFMPNGEIAWIRVTATPSQVSENEIAYNGFILNITERKQAEMEYQASERKVKAMSQAVEDALVMIDGQDKIVFWNPAAERLFGYSEAEALGMSFHAMAAPEMYHGDIKPGMERFAQTGQGPVLGTTTEITARNRRGDQFPVEVTLSSFRLEDQWYAVGTVRDISERKAAREALRESQNRLDMALTASNTGLWDWLPLDGKDFHNEQWFRQLGYTSQEFPEGSNPLMELMHPDDAARFNEAMQTYLSGDQDDYKQEFRMKAKDGSWKWILSLGKVSQRDEAGRVKRIIGVHLDMTERKEAEEALSKNQAMLQRLLDTSPVGVAISTEGIVRFANPRIAELANLRFGDTAGKAYVNIEDREQLVEMLGKQEIVRDYAMQMYDPDGGIRDILATYLRTEYEGKPGILGWLVDITKVKQAEEALRESEERSRSILDSAGEGIFGVDSQGRVTFVNPAALHMLGFREEELLGQKVHGIIHHQQSDGSDYPLEDCPMWASYTRGEPHHIDDEVLWRKDGTSFPVEYASTPIAKDGKVVGAVVTFRDTTERRQAEEELRRNLDELERFNRLTIGREEKMIALKEEINELLEKIGQDRKYKIVDQVEIQ